MLSRSALLASMVGDRVGVDLEGRAVDADATDPAVALVAPMTEAAKQVEGDLVVADLDRETLWVVTGFSLARGVVEALPDTELTPEALLEAVSASGWKWQELPPPVPPLE